MQILLAEDEVKLAAFIQQGLSENGYSVTWEEDGEKALERAKNQRFDLAIVDVLMPKMNGIQLTRELRSFSNVPILLLTALGTIDDKVLGFDSGADDYLVKPFDFKELLLRVKALGKRNTINSSIEKNSLFAQNLELDLNTMTASRSGQLIELTAKEFALLELFLRNKGRVLSRVDIAEKVWDITFDTGTNVIDVYVNFLRKKIDKEHEPKLIHTQIGMGYVLKD